jgi:hypothetical protein
MKHIQGDNNPLHSTGDRQGSKATHIHNLEAWTSQGEKPPWSQEKKTESAEAFMFISPHIFSITDKVLHTGLL